MHPILFKTDSITIYTYGFFVALGALLGGLYMWWQGKRQFGWSFDQANTLFVLLILGGVVGGKLFVILEDPTYYLGNISNLFSGSGFVFYGSLLTAIPIMLWFFKKNKIPTLAMLDIMAIVTCIVHGFGRIGCYMAGCCYGKPANGFFSVIFTNPFCQAEPKNVPLHPTQFYEASLIFSIMIFLLIFKRWKRFDGQLFISYLIIYAIGRSILEIFRGDLDRGFVVDVLSISQFISGIIIVIAVYFYVKLDRKPNLTHQ